MLCAAAVPVQASKLRRTVQDAERRKQQRRIQHSAPGAVKVKPERKKKIVAELE
jgi:WD repeat and SOF domain-containing protein 1